MAKEIKFTEEEVLQITKLRQDVSAVFTQLGQLSIERTRRIEELDELQAQLVAQHKQLQESEQTLFKGLNDKYGDGNYNPDTNTFTPASTEENETE